MVAVDFAGTSAVPQDTSKKMSSFICSSNRRLVLIALLIFALSGNVWSTTLAEVPQQPSSGPAGSQTQSPTAQSPATQDFKFGKSDLELLEQVNILDRRFERDGLVLEDDATNAYLKRIGDLLVPRGLKLENVVWKFRALRDPVPNAFALPNGSIYITTGLLALMDNESEVAAVIGRDSTHPSGRPA